MDNSKKENKIILLGIILILIVIGFTLLRPSFKKEVSRPIVSSENTELFNDYSYLLPKELYAKIINKDNILILDIRDEINFEKNHIKNSLNITYDSLSAKLNELDKKALIVIVSYNYNDKKAESATAKLLKETGFSKVVALSGGIDNWHKENFPLITSGDINSIVDRSKLEYLDPQQLKIAIENDYPVYIIDTRPILLFKQGHIPGAVNIQLNELEKNSKKISLTKEIIVYGKTPLDDFSASIKLYDLGFLANYILKGGLDIWKEKDFPLEK